MGDGDETRSDAEGGTSAHVVPSVHTTDTSNPLVTHDPTSAEPPLGHSSAQVRPDDQEVPRPGGAPASQRSWFSRQRDELIRDALIGVIVVLIGFAAAAVWDARIADRQEQLARELASNQDRLARELANNQDRLARELADSGEVLENTRFVRQVASDDAVEKPFQGLNLSGATLSGLSLECEPGTPTPEACRANFFDADLSEAKLSESGLSGADLSNANLSGADLFFTDLIGAVMIATDLSDAFAMEAGLGDANLSKADLSNADLTRAKLPGADLTEADLTGADLTQADLSGADLSGADLSAAAVTGICYDDSTTWPEGFTPTDPPSC
jgi:uncharacterized protein YjbI with pentapeptide repeats